MLINLKISQIPNEFKEALPILAKIEAAGYEAYFVGGSVRDTLLNKPIHDIDIATSAYPNEVKELFDKTVDTGIEHGTVMILDHGTGYEVTTFRTESTYQDYRRPDQVEFVRSLKEDLKRRDFTINALAMNAAGEITDLFAGIADLDQQIIRAVGDPNERFNEDALRMMRAVRFASQLNFTIEAQTKLGINHNSQLLSKIAIERIHTEFVKMMQSKAASTGLIDLVDTKMINYLPVLKDHVSQVTQLAGLQFDLTNDVQVWSLLAFEMQLAKPAIHKMLKQWKASNKVIDNVVATTTLLNHLVAKNTSNWDLFMGGYDNLVNALKLAEVLQVEVNREQLLKQYEQLQIKDSHELAISGNDLIQEQIITPGPQFGTIMLQLKQAVVAGEVENQLAPLLKAAQQYVNKGR